MGIEHDEEGGCGHGELGGRDRNRSATKQMEECEPTINS